MSKLDPPNTPNPSPCPKTKHGQHILEPWSERRHSYGGWVARGLKCVFCGARFGGAPPASHYAVMQARRHFRDHLE